MYTVVGAVKSRAFRVMWMLEELGQDYEVIPAAPRSDDAKKYNPTGKVPALLEGDDVLTDSVAIMQYLADKHEAMTSPAGTIARARQDAMTLWLIDEFDAVLWAAAKHSFVFPEDQRVPQIKPSLQAEFGRGAKLLEGMIKGPFLMGDEMTVPDILAVHCINWSIGAGFPAVEGAVAEWAQRMRDRPAFKAVRAHDS